MWTMPRNTLTIVAVLLTICAGAGFYMGFRGAAEKARLPGEDVSGGSAAPIVATDIRPLVETADTAPIPEPEPEPTEVEEQPEAPRELAVTPAAKLVVPPPVAPPAKTPPEDSVGDMLDKVAPPVEAPIY